MFCPLCVAEKRHILFSDPNTLINSRDEFVSKCRHQLKFTFHRYKYDKNIDLLKHTETDDNLHITQTIDRRKNPSRKCKNASKSRDDQITNQVSTQKSKSSSNITSHAGKCDNSSVLLRPLDINSSQLSNGTNIKKNSARRIDDIKETNTEDQQERSCKNTLYSQRGRLCKPNSKYYNKDFT